MGKLLLLLLLIAVIIGIYSFRDHFSLLSLENLKSQQDSVTKYVEQNLFWTSVSYFFIYIFATAISIPGAAVLTLAGGAFFGFWLGLLLVSFASSIGATLAFLLSRFIAREWVERKFPAFIAKANEGMNREGIGYLAFLRLAPVFPFFVVNLVMGLTRISAQKYYLVSQITMLPATAIYVNAGTQLAGIRSTSDVLSARMLIALSLVGVFPLLAKRFTGFLRRRVHGA